MRAIFIFFIPLPFPVQSKFADKMWLAIAARFLETKAAQFGGDIRRGRLRRTGRGASRTAGAGRGGGRENETDRGGGDNAPAGTAGAQDWNHGVRLSS